ncbi:Down syndrome cell adhesion molecule-like protein Dscam2 isoform X1 [Pieris napi]|uniref:Down syndrome cell adhesion molecule-like protein Dscam2 isoform X1 n=1 Tax=Pieris napi TaxID=78633 RepID=UPI001FB92D9A|nr:Down syndrome cell adhesion molecule-like protein Dscam2 isoform X1 [Pieris napi]
MHNTGAIERIRRRRSMSDGRVLMTQHFTERTLTPGGDISMQCAATADRPPQFTWQRDGVAISSNTDSRYSLGQIMRSDGTVLAQLNISRIRVEDGGLYSCSAKEGDHVAVHENRLDVYGPPYIRALPPLKVQSGETVNLRCPFYGYPISKIDWEFKGKTISSDNLFQRYKRSQHKRKNRSVSNIHGVLSILEINKDHEAQYTCIVTSPSGEMARRTFEIQVIEAPVLEDLLFGNNLQEGQIVNIYCNVRSGDLPIHFEWLKDGKRIPSGLKVVERSSELFSALIIKKVSLEHCGTYTCVATNHVATVNKTTELYIKVAPKWAEEPSNSSLLLGRRGVVSCSASGYPKPQVHWMKKDAILGTWQPVLELAGGGILSLTNGSLVIDEVSLADEGLYSCNVENGVGTPLSKTVWITVNKPVHFSTSSANITLRLGQSVALECHALGDTPITVQWMRHGHALEVHTHRWKLSEIKTNSGLRSTISIQYAETNDAGLYQCRASNPFGSSIYNVYVTILEPPTPPTELRLESVQSRLVAISWRTNDRVNAKHYTVQYAPAHLSDVRWELASTFNVTSNNEIRQIFELQNLRPANGYAVRVATVNQVAVSRFTEPLHFTTQEEPPSSPPLQVRVSQTEEPGQLRVWWSPPDPLSHNGHITGFHIKAVPQNVGPISEESNTRILKVPHQSGKQETMLSGLLKNTRYAVTISAFNSAGSGPFSSPVFQETREGAPENAPTSVECTAVSSTSLRVGWQPLIAPRHGTEILGYTILYASDESDWQNQTSIHTEQYLQNLLKYANYTIKVAGYSSYGVGPFSYPILCTTLQDVPSPPADIKVLVLSPTTLLISWKPPDRPNGEILFYTVYVKPVGSAGDAVITQRIESIRHTAEVKDLSSGRTYEAWVCASTHVGEGRASKRVTQTPTHRVVAGVSSLGGSISVGAGSSLLLRCECVGAPAARTVWYHNHNIITHHPRFTRNHDDTLLINNIDESLSGNYTCLAKNLYGSDSVKYTVTVQPLPDSPILRATPYKDSLVVEWEQPHYSMTNKSSAQKITYSLTWKEANGPWQEAWSTNDLPNISNVQKHTLTGLKCGTKYSLRITATNKVGTSQPAYLDISTLGTVPIPPTSNEWLWSNSSHMYIQLAGWEGGGCDMRAWDVEFRPLGSRIWTRARNTLTYSDTSWSLPLYQASNYRSSSFAIADLSPGTWYQVRITATNEAGSISSIYNFATKNLDGSEVGPPSDIFDLNMLVIVFSSILLLVCLICCAYILLRRQRTGNFTQYRDSLTTDNKSENGNLTTNASHNNLTSVVKENAINAQNRIYSTPIPVRNNGKHELYEISPYAQFAVGFRTFGHVDNQDPPMGHKHKYCDTETSFQMCSECEDSDTISKYSGSKCSRETCRTPHHR